MKPRRDSESCFCFRSVVDSTIPKQFVAEVTVIKMLASGKILLPIEQGRPWNRGISQTLNMLFT